jgi:predicted nucleotide-binding protein (sugar kinase/HSP70/actin superfamily)
MRIISVITRIISIVIRIISIDKKLFDDKKVSRKIYKCNKKRKIIYSINQFYDNLYDNLRKKSYLLTRDQIKFFEK